METRDYKHEYKLRNEKSRQLNTKIQKDKAEEFLKLLQGKGITYNKWLNDNIDKELKDPL